ASRQLTLRLSLSYHSVRLRLGGLLRANRGLRATFPRGAGRQSAPASIGRRHEAELGDLTRRAPAIKTILALGAFDLRGEIEETGNLGVGGTKQPARHVVLVGVSLFELEMHAEVGSARAHRISQTHRTVGLQLKIRTIRGEFLDVEFALHRFGGERQGANPKLGERDGV